MDNFSQLHCLSSLCSALMASCNGVMLTWVRFRWFNIRYWIYYTTCCDALYTWPACRLALFHYFCHPALQKFKLVDFTALPHCCHSMPSITKQRLALSGSHIRTITKGPVMSPAGWQNEQINNLKWEWASNLLWTWIYSLIMKWWMARFLFVSSSIANEASVQVLFCFDLPVHYSL